MRRDFPVGPLGERATAWLAGEVDEVAPTRDAATVMLVRDGARGLDIFTMRRVTTMAFAAGMTVFPGGGVDERDSAPDLPWAGPSPRWWASRLGEPVERATALVVAAVREVFEECGVLLAGPAEGEVVADVATEPWQAERAALEAGDVSLAEILTRRGLLLRSDLLSVRGHWVTPEFEPRRYDTRIFAALMPTGHVADDATAETDLAGWTAVPDLLAAYAAGETLMLPPTVVSVEGAAAAVSAAEFVAEQPAVPRILTRLVVVDGRPVMRVEPG